MHTSVTICGLLNARLRSKYILSRLGEQFPQCARIFRKFHGDFHYYESFNVRNKM